MPKNIYVIPVTGILFGKQQNDKVKTVGSRMQNRENRL